ncbi:hypothetical protein EJ06DRAFT_580943 [Trichodelitschia bisporula]|uniref:Ribosome biogenesis protein SLX9 n=1 Tax=Trichodelitschia bisporula TaxID=703511 RepID=A0A6G1I0T0_9PEZI|nr:hypothetical protein EJ06DRAFT_580943 [Trichodelitschia bisporula]
MAKTNPSARSRPRDTRSIAALSEPSPSNKPSKSSKSTPSASDTSSAFSIPTTKRDKHTIKRSLFLSKITKSTPGSLRRRRPNKKLVASLETLADALPDLAAETEARKKGPAPVESLKVKPGVRKRREKVEKAERERFGKNLAVLSAAAKAPVTPGEGMQVDGEEKQGAGRWAALRAHIQQNLEGAK